MIHRKQINPKECGEDFDAPENVTFGWQESRKCFSVWYRADAPHDCTYMIVGTGHDLDGDAVDLVASVVMPDGFYVFHLVRKL